MSKKLSEMTLEELWQLFPIILRAHDPAWQEWYALEAAALQQALPCGVRLNHVGSTAIRGIWAKPIVDILAEIPHGCRMQDVAGSLTALGYICMSRGEERMSFNKGYTPQGFAERVFHLHLRREGDNDEIRFRDYLNAHPDAAARYESLKLRLWKEFEHDRDGYTAAKGDFVREIGALAAGRRP